MRPLHTDEREEKNMHRNSTFGRLLASLVAAVFASTITISAAVGPASAVTFPIA
jgi:hypothetical protein